MDIVDTIEKCRSTSSRLEKMEFLREFSGSSASNEEVLKQTFVNTFDPYRTYGITFEGLQSEVNDDVRISYGYLVGFFRLLDELAGRNLTGDRARSSVRNFISKFDIDSQNFLVRVGDRDLKCGVSLGTVDKLFPGLVKSFSLQLAGKVDLDSLEDATYVIEPKLDGVRAVVSTLVGSVLSRNGKELYNCGNIVNELKSVDGLENYVLDGELLADDWNSTASIVRSSKSKVDSSSLRFWVFDIIPIDDFKKSSCKMSLHDRKSLLSRLIPWADMNYSRMVPMGMTDKSRIKSATEHFIKNGYEGSVLKIPGSMYEFGRTDSWIKVKYEVEEDVKVVEVNEGTGRLEGTLGSLTVLTDDGKKFNVGTGYSDQSRSDLWDQHLKGDLLGSTVEIAYEKAPRIVGRFPRYKRLRFDK